MNALFNPAAHVARVLIVDDERRNRDLIEAMLAQEAVDMSQAATGAEALAMVAEHAPDLILLDIMMPDMDGYAVTRLLKSDPATKGIPIILVTAHDDRAARVQGVEAGAEDFLTKPLDRAGLTVRVRNLLRLKAYIDFHATHTGQDGQGLVPAAPTAGSAEAIYRQIVENMPRGIWAVDATGTMTFMNSRMAMMLGCEVGEAAGRPLADFLYEGDEDRLPDALLSGDGELPTQVEVRLRKCDGTPVWVLLESAPLHGEAGPAEGTLFTAVDITARRKREQGLLAS